MILLKIKKPVSYKPIKWEAADLTGLQEGQSFVRYMGIQTTCAQRFLFW